MYNKAPYIERMVKSLSEQTYIDRTKIIVIDDCSTDDSVEVLKRAAEKFCVPMILKLNKKNLGVSINTRNFYRMLDTPFWTFLDPDDYYIDPRRLERAVNFLKEYPDHSMHGCNFIWEYPDKKFQAFSNATQNYSSDNLETMPFFHTSAGTFRNFWTQDLLLELERTAGKNRIQLEGDSFRNFCAIHFGKVYLDNFLGSIYTAKVGIWGSMSSLEKDVIEIDSNYGMFEFARDFFHNKTNAMVSLRLAFMTYLKVVDKIGTMMRDCSATKFHGAKYFKDMFELQNGNFEDVIKIMLDYSRKFEALGI